MRHAFEESVDQGDVRARHGNCTLDMNDLIVEERREI